MQPTPMIARDIEDCQNLIVLRRYAKMLGENNAHSLNLRVAMKQ